MMKRRVSLVGMAIATGVLALGLACGSETESETPPQQELPSDLTPKRTKPKGTKRALEPLSPPNREPRCGTSYKIDGKTVMIVESVDVPSYAIVHMGKDITLKELVENSSFGTGQIVVDIRNTKHPLDGGGPGEAELTVREGSQTTVYQTTLGGQCPD